MNIFSFFSLFKKKQKTLKLPDSLLIKKLKEVSKNNGLSIYENITIYHHTQNFFIPLLILDPTRGIYIFEYKEWSYDDLKNATVSKAINQDSSNKSLAYQKTHDFIKQKFNELIHNDGVPIYNYLLMENLNSDEFKHLDNSFKELLPYQKVMFNDSMESDILYKLKETPLPTAPMADEVHIIGNLLVQYLIFSKDKDMNLATAEQIEFIESKTNGLETLSGNAYSGKTSSILLKAILETLRNPELKIIIIEPTILSCDILKQKLLNIIEYAIIEVDITSIEIITPIDLVNKHLSKLKMPQLEIILNINDKLMHKNFNVADLIICDDSNLLSFEFINYLRHIQKNSSLILVNEYSNEDSNYRFDKSFKSTELKVFFKQANQHAKALQLISNILEKNSSKDILVVSDNLSKIKLKDDLEFFIRDEAVLLDSSSNLLSQDLDNLLLCSYSQISSMNSKFVILMDVAEASLNEIEYALNLAEESAYVLYEDESENIKTLKEKND
ncbi:hypothetical protein [Sulfurimonas sp.]|uniref:hypothetical protein n=1 Tax=Sulfurimonas sp. TaxID=2022749 RepID=UPI00356B0C53